MILITGATGFIGSHLVEELVRKGEKIRIFVKDKNKLGNIKEFYEKNKKNIEIAEGNLLDNKSLQKATERIKEVFHLAAISKPMNIPKHVYYDVNVTGTKNLLEACKKNKVNKIIHISSMSVFGYSRDAKPLNENFPKLPVSDYGKSKKQGEELALDFCKENKINLIVVRPPMVFGPRDRQFLKLFRLINSGFFPLLKKGRAKIEFCYVKNLVYGIILAEEKGKNLETYNINNGETYTIRKVFGEIAKSEGKKLLGFSIPVYSVKILGWITEKLYNILNKKPPFNSGTADWMSKDNIIDISKARKELGYERKVSLEESIMETIKEYKKRGLL